MSARHVLQLVRPDTAPADVPAEGADGIELEVRELDTVPADELIDAVFAADLVVVW